MGGRAGFLSKILWIIPIHRNGGMNSHEQPAGWCQQKGTSVCVVIFGQDRLLQQLGAFKEPMGPQLLGAREMSVWSLWSIKQIKRYACTWDWTSMYWILAVPQCFFWQFHGLYSKENQCSGWICQRWFLGYTKEYGHNAMVILEDHVMVLHSG